MITQTELTTLLTYCTDTGRFYPLAFRARWRKGIPVGKISKRKYRTVRINGTDYFEHKLAWLYIHGHYPQYPTQEIDHINGNTTDNRIENLRLVDRNTNMRNKKLAANNTSGHTGVSQMPNGKWLAEIQTNHKKKRALFNNKLDAIKQRTAWQEESDQFSPRHGT